MPGICRITIIAIPPRCVRIIWERIAITTPVSRTDTSPFTPEQNQTRQKLTINLSLAEHLIELESMELFWEWATDVKIVQPACKDIDCLFLAEFFNKKVLDNPTTLPGLDESHQKIPLQRVMEALGSEENRANFAILYETMNLNKAQVSLTRNHQASLILISSFSSVMAIQ